MDAGAQAGPPTPHDPRYEDRIEDGEPDMNDIAAVSFKRATMFAMAYRLAKSLPLA